MKRSLTESISSGGKPPLYSQGGPFAPGNSLKCPINLFAVFLEWACLQVTNSPSPCKSFLLTSPFYFLLLSIYFILTESCPKVWMHHLFFKRFSLIVCEWGLVTVACTSCMRQGQRSGDYFMWLVLWTLELELRSSGLQAKCFYPPSHLRSPIN